MYFVKPSTTAQTFNSVASIDYADYIAVKDKDGTLLENPLPLNDEGSFETQPFVEDGVEFKMIVCYPTGQPARHNDETPCWEVAYTIDSKTQTMEVHYDGVACVDGIYDLGRLQPSVGRAIVLGYASKNDFCPPRFFEWVPGESNYNHGTVLRSTVSDAGAWVCVPSGHVDVRWFGVDPNGESDYTSVLAEISQELPNLPAYFPAGYYFLSNHVTFKNAIAERGANFIPADGVTNDLKFEVENGFDNRGCHFMGISNGCVIYPKLKGTLSTSCINANANAALSATALAKIDKIVFDSFVSLESGSSLTIENKAVLVKQNAVVPSGITFGTTCIVYHEVTGIVDIKTMTLDKFWTVEDSLDQNDEHELYIRSEVFNYFRMTLQNAFLMPLLHLMQGLKLRNGQDAYNDSWMLEGSEMVLRTQKIIAQYVSSQQIDANKIEITDGKISHVLRYDDSALAVVDNGVITYTFGANPETDSYTPPYVQFSKLVAKYPDAKVITVMLSGENDTNLMDLELPVNETDVAFVVFNPKLIDLHFLHENTTVNVLVLGLFRMEKLNGETGVSKFVIRKPTDAERTRFNINANQKWIIDPLSV